MATLRINDMVINPQFGTSEFADEIFGPDEQAKRVVMIVERDMDTEEQGYTKRVQESSDSGAYVILEGGAKYRLHELAKA